MNPHDVAQLRIGVVIPTIGEDHKLDRLMESLANQEHHPHRVVVVTQGDTAAIERVLDRWRRRLCITHLECPRGASRARNVGVSALVDCEGTVFVDDDVWLESTVLGRVAVYLSQGPVAVSGALSHGDGTPYRNRYSSVAQRLDVNSVWCNTYETTTCFSRSFWDLAGPLDEQLGLGAETRWQSGEGTDFLLRGLQRGGRVYFDPDIRFHEDKFVAESPRHARERLRKYGRGTGAVYCRYYGWTRSARMMAAPLVRMLFHGVRGNLAEASLNAAVFVGRVDGYITAQLALSRGGGD